MKTKFIFYAAAMSALFCGCLKNGGSSFSTQDVTLGQTHYGIPDSANLSGDTVATDWWILRDDSARIYPYEQNLRPRNNARVAVKYTVTETSYPTSPVWYHLKANINQLAYIPCTAVAQATADSISRMPHDADAITYIPPDGGVWVSMQYLNFSLTYNAGDLTHHPHIFTLVRDTNHTSPDTAYLSLRHNPNGDSGTTLTGATLSFDLESLHKTAQQESIVLKTFVQMRNREWWAVNSYRFKK
jgi:hypothetical protein